MTYPTRSFADSDEALVEWPSPDHDPSGDDDEFFDHGALGAVCGLLFGDRPVALPARQASGVVPRHVTMTELGQQAGEVIASVEEGTPALVTKRGRFVAAVVPLDPDAMNDLILRSGSGELHAAESYMVDDDEPRYTMEEAAERLGIELPES